MSGGPDPALAPILAALQAGREAEGLAALDAFLAAHPSHVEALALAAFCRIGRGEKEAARAFLSRAAAAAPEHPMALNNLGLLSEEAEADPEEILALFRRAAAAAPADASIADNLERALVAKGLVLPPGEALAFWERETAAHPALAGLWTGLGNLLLDQGALAAAEAAFVRAAALRPGRAETRINLGIARHRQGDPEGALRLYAEAAKLEEAESGSAPSKPLLWNRALSRLALGDLEGGFADYEARDHLDAYRRLSLPRWKGEALPRGTLLLHAEQGFGDTIQFVRYAASAKERGVARVLLVCPPPLERLLASVPGVDGIVPDGLLDTCVATCACEAPLLSLPHFLGTRLETVPARTPYLFPDGERKLHAAGEPLRVGLVASGNPKYGNDLRRSIPPAALAPLAVVPGVVWTGFHFGGSLPLPWLADGMEGAADFADTAPRLREMDLVVSVDTAAAHLAGALGLPLWVLLPAAPDWRWLRGRADSPWYPTARLFRQPRDGDWDGVIAAVAQALSERHR